MKSGRMTLPDVPRARLVVSTPSMTNRLSAPLAPSIWRPLLRGSLSMPGAQATTPHDRDRLARAVLAAVRLGLMLGVSTVAVSEMVASQNGIGFLIMNYVQVFESDKLRTDPGNTRVLLDEYERQRGAIVVDGKSIAEAAEDLRLREVFRAAGELPADVSPKVAAVRSRIK